jgi:cytochrome c oxidase subunit IV
MENKEHKLISYTSYLRILVMLVLLTAITISVTVIDLATWSVMVALFIACVKGGIVLTYFMHLKFENGLLRALVIGVIVLFALVLMITFFDYLYR